MDSIIELIRKLMDVQAIIQWGGILMICVIVFVETGLFVGFFLPGDSLLVSAGIFAASGHLDLMWLLILASICAVVGDQFGYLIGRSAGHALYKRDDSMFFKKKHLQKAHDFYEKYGGKTIVIARFVPIVRTFAPAVAGAAEMNYRKFVSFNVFGGILWVFSTVLLGYFMGRLIGVDRVNKYIHIIIIVVVFLSILPGIIEFLRARAKSSAAPPLPPAEAEEK
ncbi:MAG: VTT domain-containing protein [Acidobacteria bacterium]|nr:VTT domain-containing protein [Acidobacteriota bacterium]MCL5287341.1 VTT domain-containing protein [Acidobacteriota bacterium]